MWKPAKEIAITPTPTPRVEVSPNQPEQPHDRPNQSNQIALTQDDKPLPSLKPPTILRVKLIGETPADKDLLARVAPKVPPKIKVNGIQIRIVSKGEADIELPVKNDSEPGDEKATLIGSAIGQEDALVTPWSEKGPNKSQSFEDKVAAKIVELLKQASRQKRK